MNYIKPLSIKSWAEEDQPREKLVLKGRANLSEAELIAIIIGTGTGGHSAVDISKQLLSLFNNDLNNLGRASLQDLMQIKGIGTAKAVMITAALELGRRKQKTQILSKPKITCSQDAYQCVFSEMQDLNHEEFKIMILNRNNKVQKIELISTGGIAGTVVDPKVVFKRALDNQASSIILVHNHPSGNLKPSQSDIKLTKKLVSAGQAIEINILDHLIISTEGYFSFLDEGLL